MVRGMLEESVGAEVEDVSGGKQFLWLLPAFICILFSIKLIVFVVLYCFKIENWLGAWFGGTKDDWYVWILGSFAVKLWL